MPGTVQGGKDAAATNKSLYGEDFYKRIGRIGGAKGRTGGFYKKIVCDKSDCTFSSNEHYIVQCAGFKGGKVSRRKSS